MALTGMNTVFVFPIYHLIFFISTNFCGLAATCDDFLQVSGKCVAGETVLRDWKILCIER